MTDTAPSPEAIARSFHEAYEALAPQFGYRTRAESAVPWDRLSETMRVMMIAVVRAVLIEELHILDRPLSAIPPREPTEAMCAAGVRVRSDTVQSIWRAMYDAAIAEKEGK